MIFQTPPFGTIPQPVPLSRFGALQAGGAGIFLNLIIKLMIVGAGIYALFNFILAGYAFLSAGDDAGKIAGAWAKIYQSVLGLAVAAGSIALATIFGWLLFRDAGFLLKPTIITP
jgi:hypothetical protein